MTRNFWEKFRSKPETFGKSLDQNQKLFIRNHRFRQSLDQNQKLFNRFRQSLDQKKV